LKLLAIQFVQRLATMTLEEASQDVVQKFSCVNRLQVERRFAARFESQHSLREEAIRAVAINTQTARAVNEVRAKLQFQ